MRGVYKVTFKKDARRRAVERRSRSQEQEEEGLFKADAVNEEEEERRPVKNRGCTRVGMFT